MRSKAYPTPKKSPTLGGTLAKTSEQLASEWVEDSWHETYDRAPTDGSAWLQGGDPSYRVIRGGSWRNESDVVRAAIRVQRNASVRFDTLGFRVARTMQP
jgi:formylglycine-generating enzyme required for sulfatase activity